MPTVPLHIPLSTFIYPSIGPEDSVPIEIDDREIAVRVPVMDEVQCLLASEPCKTLKPRSLYVVLLVEKDMRIKRCRTRDHLNHEEIDWQQEIRTNSYQKHGNEEIRCIVPFLPEVCP